jgi:hypothetical protein
MPTDEPMNLRSEDLLHDSRRNRRLSAVFYAFSALLAVNICAGGTNPDRGTIIFWVMLCLTFGQFFVWSVIAAYRIARGRGRRTGVILVAVITFLVVLGALIQYAGSSPPSPDPTGWTGLQVLRVLNGFFLLIVWAFLLLDHYEAQRDAKRRT